MDPTTSSTCNICKKFGYLHKIKVESSESKSEEKFSRESVLIGNFIVRDLLNIQTQEWKEKLGFDQSQPLTLSLCANCVHKAWQCFSWHQQTAKVTTMLENSRRELTEQLFHSGLFSDDTSEEQECTELMDIASSELLVDIAKSDGCTAGENRDNDQFNNMLKNGNENGVLVTSSSPRGSPIWSVGADEPSDSMELSPVVSSELLQSPFVPVNSSSLQKESDSLSLSLTESFTSVAPPPPIEAFPPPPPSPPLIENFEQPPPAKKPMRTNALGTILQNTFTPEPNGDANKEKAQMRDNVKISPTPVKPKKDVTINGSENDIHSPVVSSEPVRSPSIRVNSSSLGKETASQSFTLTETFTSLPTSPPPKEISPPPVPSPHPPEKFQPPPSEKKPIRTNEKKAQLKDNVKISPVPVKPKKDVAINSSENDVLSPPSPPQTENLRQPPPEKKPKLTATASNANADTNNNTHQKDNAETLSAPVTPKDDVITNGSENGTASFNGTGLPRMNDIDWKQIKKRKLAFHEVDWFSPWVKDHIHKLRVYKCPRCCAFYERRIWFVYHMRRHEKKILTECKLCNWYLEPDRRPLHRLFAHDYDNRARRVQNRAAPFPSQGFKFLTNFKKFEGAF